MSDRGGVVGCGHSVMATVRGTGSRVACATHRVWQMSQPLYLVEIAAVPVAFVLAELVGDVELHLS